MQKKDLVRLDRILALMSSEHAGERAAAAKAATELIRKHNLSWWQVLEGKALGARAAAAVRKSDLGIDYLEAAESRIRQLRAHNDMLEKQVQRLKDRLEAKQQEPIRTGAD